VRVGRIVLILVCGLLLSGCPNKGKKLHKRAVCDSPYRHGSPVVETACADPFRPHSDDISTGFF